MTVHICIVPSAAIASIIIYSNPAILASPLPAGIDFLARRGCTDMSTGMATDGVTDLIAHTEMHRQEMVKEVGSAAACAGALRKLHELLEHERAALQLHG